MQNGASHSKTHLTKSNFYITNRLSFVYLVCFKSLVPFHKTLGHTAMNANITAVDIPETISGEGTKCKNDTLILTRSIFYYKQVT